MKTIAVFLCAAVVVVILILVLRARRGPVTPDISSPPDDGHLRIRDLTLEDIRSGLNWKVTDPEELLQIGETLNLEDIHIEKTESFAAEDTIVYSAVFVSEYGTVSPLVLIKEVRGIDYGGDYCELHNAKWRQVGLVPNPNAPLVNEYIANPLEQDPSFNTMDNTVENFREENRIAFKKWSSKLKNSQTTDATDKK